MIVNPPPVDSRPHLTRLYVAVALIGVLQIAEIVFMFWRR